MATKYPKMILVVIQLINKVDMVMLSKMAIPFSMMQKLFQYIQVAKTKWNPLSKETLFIPMMRNTTILLEGS